MPTIQLSAVAPGMTALEHEGTRILLIRDGDDVRAFEGACPHAKAPLDKGALCEGRIICPWHMGAFDARTGALLEPVAMRGLERYPVTVEGDTVQIGTTPEPAPKPPAAKDARHFVLAGSGAASAMAACTLRAHGFTGRITMLGPDPAEPLDRTQLSKMALSAPDFDRATLPLLDPALPLDRVHAALTAIDPASKAVTLSTGAALTYDALLLATGAAPKPPHFPGPGASRIRTLRHLADVDTILAGAGFGTAAVVIGTSFIGMEAASALADRGLNVTVIGRDALPFAPILGDRVGAALKGLHEGRGVQFRLAAEIERVEEDAVLLTSGERLPAALVVAGMGVAPVTDYAANLPKREDGSLATDATLRVTDGIWAAGDLASTEGWPRVEHWRLAQQHGRVAALDMLGQGAAYTGVPFFWSAQAGKRLQMVGHASNWDDIAFDGDVSAFDFIAWYLEAGVVRAALIVGNDRASAILSYAMHQDLNLEQARRRIA